ncbi:hypothetical protein Tco_1337619 [Tanacetum coccineum]
MNLVVAKQVAIDNTLVTPDDRVKISKYNMRIDPTKTQKEPTYQVVLDALVLFPCYPAFLITADITCTNLGELLLPSSIDAFLAKPHEDFMFQIDNRESSTKRQENMPYPRFTKCLGDRHPFDLSKPLPLVESQNRLTVPANLFFNNDLAYLQRGSTNMTYATSLTKMKAAKYDLQGIEDMVPRLWSPIKVAYDRHALLVTHVKVNKWYGYGHLEEIEARRFDQKLYKFMEGDFPRLHLNDIEDMLLLIVQNRLFNLNGEDIVYLAAALLQDKLKDMANNLEMGYNSIMPRRRWSNLDKKRSRIMVKDIDHQLLEKRLLRSLEKFVGGREYGEDLRLLQRTI